MILKGIFLDIFQLQPLFSSNDKNNFPKISKSPQKYFGFRSTSIFFFHPVLYQRLNIIIITCRYLSIQYFCPRLECSYMGNLGYASSYFEMKYSTQRFKSLSTLRSLIIVQCTVKRVKESDLGWAVIFKIAAFCLQMFTLPFNTVA